MSGIIWLDWFFNIFKNSFINFGNNTKRNIGYICYFNSLDFSLGFWLDWFRFFNLFWTCLLYWNICFLLNLDRFNCLIFMRNIIRTINNKYWILNRNFLFRNKYFLVSFWNYASWNICNRTNFNCIYFTRFYRSNSF